MKLRKKSLKSRKIFWNGEKNFRIEENISESRKIFQNREKYFRIEKNISESRKMFQNQKIFCYKNREKTLNSMNSQLTFTCLKLTIETLEKGVKYVQS